jgi:hypothetical protein
LPLMILNFPMVKKSRCGYLGFCIKLRQPDKINYTNYQEVSGNLEQDRGKFGRN